MILNRLIPSNQTVLKNVQQRRLRNDHSSLAEMRTTAQFCVGDELSSLHSKALLHVSGTKGKGSTCAFAESILRHHWMRTGLFTSPHLVSLRERIRINGRIVEKEAFAEAVLRVYDRVVELQKRESVFVGYFQFLGMVAIRLFAELDVDVVVFEVGIGGRFDFTSAIVEHPKSVAITEISYDHEALLGSTIEQIATHKAGIIRPNIPCYTIKQPHEIATRVIQAECQATRAPFEQVEPVDGRMALGIVGKYQRNNASLAIKLASSVVGTLDEGLVARGLAATVWPGRHQRVRLGDCDWFFDGAHTVESIQASLVFHCSDDRSFERLLQPLTSTTFAKVFFVPPPGTTSITRHTEMASWWTRTTGSLAISSTFETFELPSSGPVLVTGSFHLVGGVMQRLEIYTDEFI